MKPKDNKSERQKQANIRSKDRKPETLGDILSATIVSNHATRPQKSTIFKLAYEIVNRRAEIQQLERLNRVAEFTLVEMLVDRKESNALQLNWTVLRMMMKQHNQNS